MKVLLILAINSDLTVYHVDVVTSFFNAKLEADVFIRIPDLLVELFPDLLPSKFIAKLVRSI